MKPATLGCFPSAKQASEYLDVERKEEEYFKEQDQRSVDSIAVSIFVDTLVELTHTDTNKVKIREDFKNFFCCKTYISGKIEVHLKGRLSKNT